MMIITIISVGCHSLTPSPSAAGGACHPGWVCHLLWGLASGRRGKMLVGLSFDGLLSCGAPQTVCCLLNTAEQSQGRWLQGRPLLALLSCPGTHAFLSAQSPLGSKAAHAQFVPKRGQGDRSGSALLTQAHVLCHGLFWPFRPEALKTVIVCSLEEHLFFSGRWEDGLW